MFILEVTAVSLAIATLIMVTLMAFLMTRTLNKVSDSVTSLSLSFENLSLSLKEVAKALHEMKEECRDDM